MLRIVGTPIGNLDDLSPRQAKAIAASDVILTEDTRSTGLLLKRVEVLFNVRPQPKQRLISYYKEKEFEKLPEVLDLLKEGKAVSLISQSGMPLISDPGLLLIRQAIKEKIPFEVIPGPTAVTAALVYSGFNPQSFMFLGFLPKKQAQLLRLIEVMKSVHRISPDCVFVFYESPKRINETLAVMNEAIPDAGVVICREMTKKFEEIVRGKPKELMDKSYKGEITVLLKI